MARAHYGRAIVLAVLLGSMIAPATAAVASASSGAVSTSTAPAAVAVQQNGTANTSANTTTGEAPPSTPANSSGMQAAELDVIQHGYINDPISQRQEQGLPVYQASGNWLDIRVQGVNHSQIRSASVAGDTASISDKGTFWRFAAGHTDGSYRVVFTLTDGTRRAAILQVDQTNLAHISESKYQDQQQAAANWSEWEQTVIGLFGAHTDVESQTEAAAEFLRFKSDPFAYVLQNPVSVLLILTTQPGGIFIIAVTFAAVFGVFSGVSKIANRWRRFSGDEASIEEKQDEIELAQKQSALEGDDLNSVFGHWAAERWRQFLGIDSLFKALLVAGLPFMNHNMLRDRLAVMHHHGYRAKISRAASDGGADDASGDDAAAPIEAVDIGSAGEDGYDRGLADLDEEAVEWLAQHGHDEINRFNLPAADDPRVAETDVPVDLEYDLETMADELWKHENADISPKESAEQLGELFAHMEQHPITDKEGNVQSLRVVLNAMLRVFNVAGDCKGVPMVRVAREHIEWLLNVHREEREIDEHIQDIRHGNLDLDDTFEDFRDTGGASSDD